MSHVYRAVGWSPQKRGYDLLAALCMTVYLGTFAGVTLATQPHVTFETLLLRATGSLAFVMLSFVLAIGPLARVSPRFLPVLHNRRHLGVATFLVALVHGVFATVQFHALGDVNPLASVLSSDGAFGDGGAFPFQPLGAVGLGVLFLLAATSHDFWLANLTPRVWKGLHMAVYGAYAVLVGHVALGTLQDEAKAYLWPVTGALAATVFALQLWTGIAERRRDRAAAATRNAGGAGNPQPGAAPAAAPAGYVRTAIRAGDIADGHARIAVPGGERVAVFREGDRISCVSNVCRHQMGPLGEGRIVDGRVTCPWHGFQYDPVTGCAPPPFDDRIETYDVAIRDGMVWVNPRPNPLGTASRTARLPAGAAPATPPGDAPPPRARPPRRAALATLVAAAVAAAVIAPGHRRLPAAHFEFGHVRDFEGFVAADPYPSLLVPAGEGFARHLLTAPGKFGADDLVASATGRWASLRGTLAHRDDLTMIQVEPGTVAPLDTDAPPPRLPEADLGTRRVEGEIAGSKCYLGVMNPGSGVTHRACAAVCVRGGVPPLLEVRRADGGREGIVLAGRDGEAVGDRLEGLIATPVGVTGRLVRRGGATFLYADPGEIRRLR